MKLIPVLELVQHFWGEGKTGQCCVFTTFPDRPTNRRINGNFSPSPLIGLFVGFLGNLVKSQHSPVLRSSQKMGIRVPKKGIFFISVPQL